jgi:hypothetical protein
MIAKLNDFNGIIADALLSQHGGRGRLRLLPDEDLRRAHLAILREQATAPETIDESDPLTVVTWAIGLSIAARAIETEEERRQRAYAIGIPRDNPATWVPDEVVTAIKERVSPVDLCHRWGLTDLRATGRGKSVGLCPFHEDSSPSFYVYTANPHDMHWHCFGCLLHGDVFDLAQRHTGRDFREVCEGLASVAGLDWPPPPAEPPPPPRVVRLSERAARVMHGS